jgi:hypothetical protein
LAVISGLGYYALTCASLILLVYNNASMFYILDLCEEVFEITDYNNIPMYGTGIAYYLSCFPNELNSMSAALGYNI